MKDESSYAILRIPPAKGMIVPYLPQRAAHFQKALLDLIFEKIWSQMNLKFKRALVATIMGAGARLIVTINPYKIPKENAWYVKDM